MIRCLENLYKNTNALIKIVSLSLLAWGVITASSAQAHTTMKYFEDAFIFKPYVGLDAQGHYMKFKKGLGDRFFPKTLFQGNAFVGLQFHPNAALELGYSHTASRTKFTDTHPGQQVLGDPEVLGVGDFCRSRTKLTMESINLNLQTYTPISFISNKLEAILNFGLSFSKPSIQYEMTQCIENGINHPDVANIIRSDVKHKTVARLGGGLQYKYKYFGLRTLLLWENTSRFTFVPIGDATVVSAHLKDTFIYSIGAFVQFF